MGSKTNVVFTGTVIAELSYVECAEAFFYIDSGRLSSNASLDMNKGKTQTRGAQIIVRNRNVYVSLSLRWLVLHTMGYSEDDNLNKNPTPSGSI